MSVVSSSSTRSRGSGVGGEDKMRKTTANKDDITRKKLERELSTSSTSSLTHGTKKAAAPPPSSSSSSSSSAPPPSSSSSSSSSVSSIMGSAMTVAGSASVLSACKQMATKRSDCVLILGPRGPAGGDRSLQGILTDKDIAYRVVAAGLNPHETQVSQVMTANPLHVAPSTEAGEALLRMAQGRFRHLPVVDDSPNGPGVVGVVDVIRCLYGSIARLDRAYEAAKALHAAMQDATSQWAGLQSDDVMANLRDRMTCPPIRSVVDPDARPPTVSPKDTVRDAANLMKAEHASAVLVVEPSTQRIAGIFTSKDIVLRVIGNGLDPDKTSIVRVMTPHPTSVRPDTSVLDALKQMQAGRYLHLPVVNEDLSVFALVDVLSLTYSTLGQEDSMHRPSAPRSSSSSSGGASAPTSSWSNFYHATLASEDVFPNNASSLDPHHDSFSDHGGSAVLDDNFDSVSMASGSGVEEETMGSFVFKLRLQDGSVTRFSSRNGDLKGLKENVFHKLQDKLPHNIHDPSKILLSYVDEEGDIVTLTNDEDLFDAVSLARSLGWKRIQLNMQEPEGKNKKETASSSSSSSSVTAAAASAAATATAPLMPHQEHAAASPLDHMLHQQQQQVSPPPPHQVHHSPSSAPNKLPVDPLYIIAGLSAALVVVGIMAMRK